MDNMGKGNRSAVSIGSERVSNVARTRVKDNDITGRGFERHFSARLLYGNIPPVRVASNALFYVASLNVPPVRLGGHAFERIYLSSDLAALEVKCCPKRNVDLDNVARDARNVAGRLG